MSKEDYLDSDSLSSGDEEILDMPKSRKKSSLKNEIVDDETEDPSYIEKVYKIVSM